MADKTRREQIEDMLADDPNDPFLRYGLAMEYASAGDDAGAVGCLQELLRATPDYVPAYHQAGLALVRLGSADEARALLGRGIAAARQAGNLHAAEEMQGLLDSIS